MSDDFRLVTARQLLWKNQPNVDPAFRALVIRTLEDIVANPAELQQNREAADRVIHQLYAQGKAAAEAAARARSRK